jgi:hypothetical protein
MLCAVCCVLCAVCCVLCAVCYVLCAVCRPIRFYPVLLGRRCRGAARWLLSCSSPCSWLGPSAYTRARCTHVLIGDTTHSTLCGVYTRLLAYTYTHSSTSTLPHLYFQGLTLDRAEMELSKVFECGQVWRARIPAFHSSLHKSSSDTRSIRCKMCERTLAQLTSAMLCVCVSPTHLGVRGAVSCALPGRACTQRGL